MRTAKTLIRLGAHSDCLFCRVVAQMSTYISVIARLALFSDISVSPFVADKDNDNGGNNHNNHSYSYTDADDD